MNGRIVLLVLGWLGAVSLHAESSVWRAERDGAVIYFGGTCHFLRASDYPLPPEFDRAYVEAERLIFETDLAAMADVTWQRRLLAEGRYADGSTLRDHVEPETWTAIADYAKSAGLPLPVLASMKPWMLTVTIAVLEWQKLGAAEDGVDAHFDARARVDGKAVAGLEEIEQHLSYLTSLAVGEEDEMIRSTLRDIDRAPDIIDEVISAWRAGDVAHLDEELFGDMREEFPAVHEALITGRNRKWMEQIETFWATPEVEFVLVGVGHFGGEEGLLTLLRRSGAAVTRIQVPGE